MGKIIMVREYNPYEQEKIIKRAIPKASKNIDVHVDTDFSGNPTLKIKNYSGLISKDLVIVTGEENKVKLNVTENEDKLGRNVAKILAKEGFDVKYVLPTTSKKKLGRMV